MFFCFFLSPDFGSEINTPFTLSGETCLDRNRRKRLNLLTRLKRGGLGSAVGRRSPPKPHGERGEIESHCAG